MIHTSLDTIPYKTFIKITETGDVSLLSDTETDIEKLNEIWLKLYDEHLSKNQTSESKRLFSISKQIDGLLTLNRVVLMACESLRFQFDQELFDILIGIGYRLDVD